MVTDQQVRRLFKLVQTERNVGMDVMRYFTIATEILPFSWDFRQRKITYHENLS
jgi:hypothetical protein